MCKNKLSKYVRLFPSDNSGYIILYNSRNRAIVEMEKKYIQWPFIYNDCSQDYLDTLEEYGYFDEDISDVYEWAKEEEDNLIISIETMLKCNLSCPYCYQIGGKSKNILSQQDIDSLINYIRNVFNRIHYSKLTIKVLGGEPALQWNIVESILKPLKDFTKENNIAFHLMLDTNGTIIDKYLSLTDIDSLLFTIPLTYRECHNKTRFYRSGKGTYDDIVNNINTLKEYLPQSTIVLRYNVDSYNIGLFEQYIKDISEKLNFIPIVSPNFTMDLGDGGYDNPLTHKEFINWLSSECIDILAKFNYDITISPYTLSEKCQYWSKYSMKIFSDGTVGACAMSFFADKRPHISELSDDIDKILVYWEKAKQYSILNDDKCMQCDSIYLCGGTYNLPCISSLKISKCEPNGVQHINLELFIKRYLYHCENGKENLFVGFNDYNLYK